MSAGTYTYSIGIVGPDGGVTIPGPTSEAITIAANHNITVSSSTYPGATRYVVYRNGSLAGTTLRGLTGIAAKPALIVAAPPVPTELKRIFHRVPELYPGLITIKSWLFPL